MAISSSKTKKNGAASKTKLSRAALEQKALEGRGGEVYRYFLKYELNDLNDMTLLYLSWIWMYCDPKKELTIDQFMDMTEPQIHDRFEKLSKKERLKVLDTFDAVIKLYGIEDDQIAVPYRYAV